jgi:hypothetical protein
VLESLEITTFAGRVGEVFLLAPDETTVIVTRLIAVTPAPGGSAGRVRPGARTPFSLVLRSPPGAPLPQRIYRLQHEELGALDLFLVPIGPDDAGMCYEAVFS